MCFRTGKNCTDFKRGIDKFKDKEHHQHFSSKLAAKLINNTQPKIKDLGIESFWETLKNNVDSGKGSHRDKY